MVLVRVLAVVAAFFLAMPAYAQDGTDAPSASAREAGATSGSAEDPRPVDDVDAAEDDEFDTAGEPVTTTPPPAAADDARGEDVVASFGDAIGDRGLASHEPPPGTSTLRIAWREEWPRYSFDEAVLTVGLGALLLAAELLPTATFRPNWRGGILFDDGVRDGLRLREYSQRESARIASEVLQGVLLGFPYVVDALFVAGIGEGSWDLALQMGLVSLEANVIALVFWRITSLLARRERPVATACAAGDDSPHCDDRQTTQSFFSNQATNAFTSAGLTCLHHTTMSLWGDEAADATACVGALTVASVAGLLRVMSDFEYLTDVLTGAVVGLLSGWLLPYLLHYQGGARPELRSPVAVIPAPMIGDNMLGLQAAGWF